MDVLKYLKTFTEVPNNFLDDLFSMYDYKTKDTYFVIDLDKAIKWLDAKKYNIKATLKLTYKKDIDYIVSKEKSNNPGRQNEKILLTPLCFKRICQLTRSKKGDQIRDYFISVEKAFINYRNYIINGLMNKIERLEHDQKPRVNPEKGVIYVFKSPDSGIEHLYKIGMAKSLKKRLLTHESALAHKIELLFILETNDIREVEKCAKTFLEKYAYKKFKEIYKVDLDIIKFFITQCNNISVSGAINNVKNINLDKNDNLYLKISK